MDCTAFGVPSPKVTWLRIEPRPGESGANSSPLDQRQNDQQQGPPIVIQLTSNYAPDALWQILAHNNSLKFRPFAASEYKPGVHRASYVCKASSESGTILSRIVNVRAGKTLHSYFMRSEISLNGYF